MFENQGFKYLGEKGNFSTHVFNEFTVYLSYVNNSGFKKYLTGLYFNDIMSKEVFKKLYKLMGCENASDGRKCIKEGARFFKVSIE
jgi:hypothetical protein